MMFNKEILMKSLEGKGIKFEITPRVEMSISDKQAELYLYGDVIEDSYVWDKEEEYISCKKVREQLDKLEGQNLKVHINSFGGMTFEGIAIYNALMDYKGEIEVQIDGIAASAASLIAMAGNKITGRNNTMLMIHKGWSYAMGNAEELRKSATMLEKVDMAADETYMNRFKGSREELNQLISDETWMTAEEALEHGFYDEILSDAIPVIPIAPNEPTEPESKETEKPKSLFDLWKEQSQTEKQVVNLFAQFKEEK